MHIIAVSRRPIGRLVALHRVQFDVGGQQIITPMGFLITTGHKMGGMKAFANQPALHIDKTGQDRVNRARSNGCFQLVKSQIGGHGGLLS